MSNISTVIKKQIETIKIDGENLEKIKKISNDFCKELSRKLKDNSIKAEVFIGGSLAKETLIKTDENKYDVDIFVRFDKKYLKEDISKIAASVLDTDFIKIHGSRDYFQKSVGNIILEIIPVIKVKKPEEAENITDLSYFHVNYVLKKIRNNKRLADEIRLAKAFCHGQDCYGAESYIKGFSGYAVELLTIHYKSFEKILKAMDKINQKKEEKIIIDTEKLYKNKKEILLELNESKLQSPIVLIDPTFKERNALSGLGKETFDKFKKSCSQFLKKPDESFFVKKNVSEEFKKYKGVKKILIKTTKQAGDIAGTKSKKFFRFFIAETKREFEIEKTGFEYDENKNVSYGYLILKVKREEVVKGPEINRIEHLKRFKERHPDAFVKKGTAYAKVSHNMNFEDFLKGFLDKNKRIIKEMGISGLMEVD